MLNMFFNQRLKWKPYPGCFERHLQRRYKSFLFPIDRQEVSLQELQEARQKDSQDCHEFLKLYVYGNQSFEES